MSSSKLLILKNNGIIQTLNEKNMLIDTTLNIDTLTPSEFLLQGFDRSLLDIVVSTIDYPMIETIKDSLVYYKTSSIKTSLSVNSINVNTSLTNPIITLNVPSYTISSSLENTDKILYYTDDEQFLPEIQNVVFSPSITHNTTIIGKTKVFYNYNEKIKYSVYINGTLAIGPTSLQNSYDEIVFYISASLLQTGVNDIELVVTTEGGKTSSKTMLDVIELINSKPKLAMILSESNSYKIHATLMDDDIDDTVRYKISIDNSKGINVLVPWSKLSMSPIDIEYSWDSSVVDIDDQNTLIIEFEDNYGEHGTYNYYFTGKYNGLLFLDINNKYYSTDKMIEMKKLDFGTIVAGRTTDPVAVKLKNSSLKAMSNLKISTVYNTTNPGHHIKLSKTNNPFVEEESLMYGVETLIPEEEIVFYTKLATEKNSEGLLNFEFHIDAEELI